MRWTRPLAHSTLSYPVLRFPQWCHSTPTMIFMVALLADAQGWQASRLAAVPEQGKEQHWMPV